MKKLTPSSTKWLRLLLLFCVGLSLSIGLYMPGLNGPFLLDDLGTLQPLADLPLSIEGLRASYYQSDSGIHPITRVIPIWSFVVTFQTLGDSTYAFKLSNVVIHAFIGAVVFLFVHSLVGLLKSKTSKDRLGVSISVALLWLVHPLFVSTVLYSVQRIAQFSTLFTFISLTLYCWARASNSDKRKLLIYLLFLPMTFLMALMSKENSVLLPLMILLIEMATRASEPKSPKIYERRIIFCYTIVPIILGILLTFLLADRLFDYSHRDFTLEERLLSQIFYLGFYIKQILLPKISDMTLFFDGFRAFGDLDFQLILLLLGHLIVIITSLRYLQKGSLIAFGLLFFYVGHALESSFLPLEMAFEHRNYLPSVGLLLSLVVVIHKYIGSHRGMILVAGIALLFATLTHFRVGFWSTEQEWIKTQIVYQPNSVRARLSYLSYLGYSEQEEEFQKEIDLAVESFEGDARLRIVRLVANCQGTNIKEVVDEDFEKLKQIIVSNGVSISVASQLDVLAWQSILNRCENYSVDRVQSVVNSALIKVEEDGANLLKGYLLGTQGLIYSSRQQFEAARVSYMSAYRHVGNLFVMLDTIIFFAKRDESRPIATALYEQLKSIEAHSNEAYREKIEEIEKLINSPQTMD